MDDSFTIPEPRKSKHRKKCILPGMLQPTKRPGFSMGHPGMFKESLYWKTFAEQKKSDEVQQESSSDSQSLPSPIHPVDVITPRSVRNERIEIQERVTELIDSPEGLFARKCSQYRNLVEGCRQMSITMLENLDDLFGADTIASETVTTVTSPSHTIAAKTVCSDTNWLDNFHADERTVASFDLETQLLNDIIEAPPDFMQTPIPAGKSNDTTCSFFTPIIDNNVVSVPPRLTRRDCTLAFEEDPRVTQSHFCWDDSREIHERSQRSFFDEQESSRNSSFSTSDDLFN